MFKNKICMMCMKLLAGLSVSLLSVSGFGSQPQKEENNPLQETSPQQKIEQPAVPTTDFRTHGVVLTKENMDQHTYRDQTGKTLVIKKEVEEISDECFVSMPLKNFDAVWFFLTDDELDLDKFFTRGDENFPRNIKELRDFFVLAKIVSLMRKNKWTVFSYQELGKITDTNLQGFCGDWLSKNRGQNPMESYQNEILTKGDPLNRWNDFVNQSLKKFVPSFLQGVDQLSLINIKNRRRS